MTDLMAALFREHPVIHVGEFILLAQLCVLAGVLWGNLD